MAEAIKFTGTLVFVGEIDSFTSQKFGKVFVKRDIAVVDDPEAQYQTVVVATLKKSSKSDNTKLVSEKDINRPCTLSYFPDGRFYTDKKTGKKKAMAGNTAWKIDFMGGAQAGDDADVPAPAEPDPSSIASADDDDMPF